jgi:hypothetical protein
MFNTFFSEDRAVYEITSKENGADRGAANVNITARCIPD